MNAPAGLVVYRIDVGGVAIAIAVFASPAASSAALTRAEREVVGAVASGLSNREIAEARGTSERTVANQIASIFRKLGVESRAALVAESALLRA
ncbi:MAG: LuxR C-terminal-related transcriptional regulator [Polyangiales bacterium]